MPVLLTILLLSGCAALPQFPPEVQDLGPSYHPSNIYRETNALPSGLRRVALLPLTISTSSTLLNDGAEILEPLIYSELEKSHRFEVIPVTPQQMKRWTGQNCWRSDEALPPDLFARVSQATGCDAVLFAQLTHYTPYPPLAVGWKFNLVENPTNSSAPPEELKPQILWSADELLDAGEPSVTTGARAYYAEHVRDQAPSADGSIILNSPAQFG